MDTSGRRGRQTEQDVPLAMGRTEAGVEAAAVRLGTNRVYRFRVQHPWVYGGIAFIIGAFLVGLFIASGYSSWSYQAINLVTAVLCAGVWHALRRDCHGAAGVRLCAHGPANDRSGLRGYLRKKELTPRFLGDHR